MKNNNLLKYLLIIIVIVIISLALFYLYNYITTNNEPFVSLTGTMDDINTITGEPKINDDKTVNLIVDTFDNIDTNINSVSVLQLLCSNNKGFYGIKNNADRTIYYYNPENNETTTFEKFEYMLELPTTSDGSEIKNPDYKNRIPICGGLLLNVSNKALWYYNDILNDMENVNIDGLYYSTLDEDGKPILNNNKVVLKCLRLPLLSNLPLTTQPGDKPHAPYDTIKYMAVNNDVLFAVGCYETTQVIYYCKLTDGIPETNDASNWKTTQIGNVMVENIKDIFINDNYLFIISLTNDDNYKPIYKIHYNKIEFYSNNILISDFNELSLLSSSYTSPKFYFNNNILYIYDIDFSSRQINLKYIDITDLTQPLTIKKITFSNEEYTLPDNLMKYQNLLITSNNAKYKYSILELYDDTHTTTNTTNTTNIINDIRKMFNHNYDPTATTSSSGAGTTSPSSTSGAGTGTSGSGAGTGTGTGTTSPSSTSGAGTGTGTTTSGAGTGSGTGTTSGTGTGSGTGTTTSGSGTGSGTGSTTSGTGTGAGAGTGTTTSGSSSGSGTGTTTSGTALPSPTKTPSGNQSPGSFVFGSAWRTGSLLNNELDNIANTDDGIPINDINFEELSGVNMLINGRGNTGNFNDFVAKNRVFGNNLFFINKN